MMIDRTAKFGTRNAYSAHIPGRFVGAVTLMLALIFLPFVGQAQAWAEFEARCIEPFMVEQPFQTDGLTPVDYPEYPIAAWRSEADGWELWIIEASADRGVRCSIGFVRSDQFYEDRAAWAIQAIETGEYEIEDQHSHSVTLRSVGVAVPAHILAINLYGTSEGTSVALESVEVAE